jgi:hypothetical protein
MLLGLFMASMTLAPLTEFLKLKALLKLFLILSALVPNTLAFGTFEFDEIILRHTFMNSSRTITEASCPVNL